VGEGGLVPSRSLERITLLDVRRAVHGPGAELTDEARVGRILKDVEGEAERRLSEVSFRELVMQAPPTSPRGSREDQPTAATS
jgi:membrane protein